MGRQSTLERLVLLQQITRCSTCHQLQATSGKGQLLSNFHHHNKVVVSSGPYLHNGPFKRLRTVLELELYNRSFMIAS